MTDDRAVGAREVSACYRVIHRSKRLGIEPVWARRVERETAATVGREHEHADGVARGRLDGRSTSHWAIPSAAWRTLPVSPLSSPSLPLTETFGSSEFLVGSTG